LSGQRTDQNGTEEREKQSRELHGQYAISLKVDSPRVGFSSRLVFFAAKAKDEF
jgi:hypothetical protein